MLLALPSMNKPMHSMTGSTLLSLESDTYSIKQAVLEDRRQMAALQKQIQMQRTQLQQSRVERAQLQEKQKELQTALHTANKELHELCRKREGLSAKVKSINEVGLKQQAAADKALEELRAEQNNFVSRLDDICDCLESRSIVKFEQNDLAIVRQQLKETSNEIKRLQEIITQKEQQTAKPAEDSLPEDMQEIETFLRDDGHVISRCKEMNRLADAVEELSCSECKKVPFVEGLAFSEHIRVSAVQLESMLTSARAISPHILLQIAKDLTAKQETEAAAINDVATGMS